MKKLLLLYILTFCTALASISGCGKTPNQEMIIYTDYPFYDNVEDAKKSATLIIEGKIISSTVVLLDPNQTLTDKQKEDPEVNPGVEPDSLSLPYTVYEVEIQKSYKGKAAKGDTIEIKQLGGPVGNINYTEEDAMKIEIGGTYILFLETYSDSPASLINQIQGIYKYKDNKITGNSKNNFKLDLEDLE